LGFEIIAHINHGKAKSELDRQNFSALPKVMRLAHDLNFLLGFQMIKLSRSVVITAAGNHLNPSLLFFSIFGLVLDFTLPLMLVLYFMLCIERC